MAKNYNMLFAGEQEAALIGGQQLRNLIYKGRLNNVTIINGKDKNNPYLDKLTIDYSPDVKIGISSLGTPVYTDLTLLGLSYTDPITNKLVTLKDDRYRTGDKTQSTGGNTDNFGAGFYMNIETVLITVAQAVNVIKTKIQGRNGTVKEYIGLDDAALTISGVITGKNGVYPREEVERLKAWLDAPVSKGVVAWWLQNMGISNIVVENYNLPQMEGGYSYQTFNISAISDLPVELKITSPIQ